MSDAGANSETSLGKRVTGELREFAIIATYLYVCFTALAFLKASILHDEGIQFAPWAFAAIKAAVSAKFILVGRALHLGEGFRNYPLIVPTLYRSITFVVFVTVLTIIEEITVGYLHGRTIMDSLSEMGGGMRDQRIATILVLLLIFIPYFAFRSLGDIIGDRVLVRLYFERRQ
ncbi:MAG: hypothetical protein WBC84_13380 [Pseudolabrys sp.]